MYLLLLQQFSSCSNCLVWKPSPRKGTYTKKNCLSATYVAPSPATSSTFQFQQIQSNSDLAKAVVPEFHTNWSCDAWLQLGVPEPHEGLCYRLQAHPLHTLWLCSAIYASLLGYGHNSTKSDFSWDEVNPGQFLWQQGQCSSLRSVHFSIFSNSFIALEFSGMIAAR